MNKRSRTDPQPFCSPTYWSDAVRVRRSHAGFLPLLYKLDHAWLHADVHVSAQALRTELRCEGESVGSCRRDEQDWCARSRQPQIHHRLVWIEPPGLFAGECTCSTVPFTSLGCTRGPLQRGHCSALIHTCARAWHMLLPSKPAQRATSGTKPCELRAPWTGLKSAHQTGLLSGAVWHTFTFVLPINTVKSQRLACSDTVDHNVGFL